MTGIGEPQETEYAPFFEAYVARVRGHDILETLERQVGQVRRTLGSVPEARAVLSYAEGKWSVRSVVGHCSDAERVFAYRALAFARGETAPLPVFDENLYEGSSGHEAIPLHDLVEEFAAVRAATLHLLRSLPPDAWPRSGIASGKQVTVRALAFIAAGHVAHHMAILEERYRIRE